jgi:putative ABC transport system substrate-binding protein
MFRKTWIIIAVVVTALGGIVSYKKLSQDPSRTTIGILQTASHPALDQAREGFITEMGRLSEDKIDFVIQNAEGSLSQAQSIANNFHAHKKIKAIFAIGTPAVQAAAKAEKEKPIFIAAVSDPESLGVVFPGSNVCGTTDQVSTDAQADLILKLVPAVQTVAIVYNPGENNSQVMVKKMRTSLQQKGLQFTELGVHAENEIAQTIAAAAHKGEAILIPNDNLLAGAMTLVAKEAAKKRSPLFVSDIALIEKGPLAAQGAEYSDLGKATADLAHRVLFLHHSPDKVGIVHPASTKIVINQGVLQDLRISLPNSLSSAILTEGGSHAR